jgi:transposase
VSDITTFVGLDVHKKDIYVAMLVGAARQPDTWQVSNESKAVRHLIRKLERDAPGPIECCYEAGACGYALQRQMSTARIRCQVIAPGLVPRKPGDRVRTDRRDARKLAEMLRAGLLTAVRPPTEAEEAVRDLCRGRDDVREDLMRCRHRLTKMLLRRGLHYAGRSWTDAHRAWLRRLEWTHDAERAVIGDYLLAIAQMEARLATLDAELTTVAERDPYRVAVGWLRCFRGIDTLTAVVLLAELHDFRRFRTAPELMAYIGLVPSEDSSGAHTARGRITRAGNSLVRRVLVEAAWHYQFRPGVGRALRRRRQGQPASVIAVADKAQHRLCSRFRRLALHKERPKVVVAVARELIGFIWAVLQQQPRMSVAA